jgi:hypothetical protein
VSDLGGIVILRLCRDLGSTLYLLPPVVVGHLSYIRPQLVLAKPLLTERGDQIVSNLWLLG